MKMMTLMMMRRNLTHYCYWMMTIQTTMNCSLMMSWKMMTHYYLKSCCFQMNLTMNCSLNCCSMTKIRYCCWKMMTLMNLTMKNFQRMRMNSQKMMKNDKNCWNFPMNCCYCWNWTHLMKRMMRTHYYCSMTKILNCLRKNCSHLKMRTNYSLSCCLKMMTLRNCWSLKIQMMMNWNLIPNCCYCYSIRYYWSCCCFPMRTMRMRILTNCWSYYFHLKMRTMNFRSCCYSIQNYWTMKNFYYWMMMSLIQRNWNCCCFRTMNCCYSIRCWMKMILNCYWTTTILSLRMMSLILKSWTMMRTNFQTMMTMKMIHYLMNLSWTQRSYYCSMILRKKNCLKTRCCWMRMSFRCSMKMMTIQKNYYYCSIQRSYCYCYSQKRMTTTMTQKRMNLSWTHWNCCYYYFLRKMMMMNFQNYCLRTKIPMMKMSCYSPSCYCWKMIQRNYCLMKTPKNYCLMKIRLMSCCWSFQKTNYYYWILMMKKMRMIHYCWMRMNSRYWMMTMMIHYCLMKRSFHYSTTTNCSQNCCCYYYFLRTMRMMNSHYCYWRMRILNCLTNCCFLMMSCLTMILTMMTMMMRMKSHNSTKLSPQAQR
jgi:hypothetical protein